VTVAAFYKHTLCLTAVRLKVFVM